MIPAAVYARESIDDSQSKHASIPAQLEEIRRYAKQNNYEIISEYTDPAMRGWDNSRPALDKILQATRIKDCPFKAILVWDLSRFYRDAGSAITIDEELFAHGIILCSVTEGYIEGEEGLLARGFKHIANQYYSIQLGRSVLRGLKHCVSQGYAATGFPPYGYKKIPVFDERNKVHMKYSVDSSAAAVVRRIYEMYASGEWSYARIAKQLNAEHIPSPAGKQWGNDTIYKILVRHTQTYLGNMVYNKTQLNQKHRIRKKKPPEEWVICENSHEPIITQEMADTVARIRAQGERSGSWRVQRFVLLRGILECGNCGRRMSSKTNGSGYYYYYCPRKVYAKSIGIENSCFQEWIRMDRLDPVVSSAVLDEICVKDFGKVLGRVYDQKAKSQKKTMAGKKKEIDKRLEVLQSQKKNILNAIADGLPFAAAKDKMMSIEDSIEICKKELSELMETGGFEEERENAMMLAQMIAHIDRHYLEETPHELRKLLLLLVDKITIRNGEATIHWNIGLPKLCIQYR